MSSPLHHCIIISSSMLSKGKNIYRLQFYLAGLLVRHLFSSRKGYASETQCIVKLDVILRISTRILLCLSVCLHLVSA